MDRLLAGKISPYYVGFTGLYLQSFYNCSALLSCIAKNLDRSLLRCCTLLSSHFNALHVVILWIIEKHEFSNLYLCYSVSQLLPPSPSSSSSSSSESSRVCLLLCFNFFSSSSSSSSPESIVQPKAALQKSVFHQSTTVK
jgi:hypothetical protein